MDIFLQNEALLEVGRYCSVWYFINFMHLQIMCVEDAEGREATSKKGEGLGLDHKGASLGQAKT